MTPPVIEIALNVEASEISGPLGLAGGTFPMSQSDKGEIALQGAHAEDHLVLGQTYNQSYKAFVVNGSYDFLYQFDAGGSVVPLNELAEVISDRNITADGAIAVDVGAVSIAATFTLNGSPFPAQQYDGARFYLQPVGTDELILLGHSHLANPAVRVIPGNYHVIYDYRMGTISPINKRSRVLENVALTTSQQLPVNVVASSLRLTFTLNGNPFPASEYNDANFFIRDKVTQAESLLMNSHAPVVSVFAVDGTYDVIYRHETGSVVPINKAAVVVTDFVLSDGGSLVHDVSAVTISANVTLNGSPFPMSEYKDGNIFLYDPRTQTDTALGNTHSPFVNLVLIPGTYDVLFTHETGNEVPQNIRGTVAKNVVVANANLNINVVGVQIDARITLNGEAFPVSEYNDANFFLAGASTDADILIGNSHDKTLSVMVMPGTYDLYYRHETGDDVPRNNNFRLLPDLALTTSTTVSTNIEARHVRVSATLNGAPFPDNLLSSGRIYARSSEGDDVLMLRTHGVPNTPLLIHGSYEFYYQYFFGLAVPRNPWAKVGEAMID